MKYVARLAWVVCLAVGLICGAPQQSGAAVHLKDVCTVLGQQEVHLTGLGLVAGLQGTGDNKFNPTINALRTALGSLNDRDLRKNRVESKGLLGAKNVALVLVQAIVPAQGVKRGQKIDCTVSAIGSATSLRGGQLMASPLSDFRNETVMGIASGALRIHEAETKTRGKLSAGVQMVQDFSSEVIYSIGNNIGFYLLLDTNHASFQAAREVARLVNENTETEASDGGNSVLPGQVARVRGEGTVEVVIPDLYRDDPYGFIAIVLETTFETSGADARVIVNKTTKTVVITGEVVISPTVLTHKGLQIAIADGNGEGVDDFIPLVEQLENPGEQAVVTQEQRKLEELLGAMKQLKLPADDIIDVVLNLEKAGVLHARVIVEE